MYHFAWRHQSLKLSYIPQQTVVLTDIPQLPYTVCLPLRDCEVYK